VNAPAIPHELIESALFGHEEGAFTGAVQQRVGFCEQAENGTLFLDEICEMDYQVQAKLLRFLQDHTLQRVGACSAQSVNVRILAATNRDSKQQIRDGKLREDLFYRLNVVTIKLPSLRDRPDDIPLLIDYFLGRATAQYSRPAFSFSAEALHLLTTYTWPGNIRQLEHVISSMVIANNCTELDAGMLPNEITQSASSLGLHGQLEYSSESIPSLREMERQLISLALTKTRNVVPEAARHLGISAATLYRKIKTLS